MLRLVVFVTIICSAYGSVLDPCRLLKCNKPDIPCLELIPNTGSYGCKCSKACYVNNVHVYKQLLAKNMESQQEKINQAKNLVYYNASKLVPIARQGGSSCYPSACMNGGTCYSYINPPTLPQQTTTTTVSYNQPLCSCQPEFAGSRCEMYNPNHQQSYTANSYNNGWSNLCRVYNDHNLNICQNGGQCVFVSDGKVACVCPSTYAGQYCENSMYVQCRGPACAQCHRDYGVCNLDGTCTCRPGYTGQKCDIIISGLTTTSNPATTTSLFSTTSLFTTTTTSIVSSTFQPRCNFTITLRNIGAYTARLRVQYTIDGIQQPAYVSPNLPIIGNEASVTIPWYSRDIFVMGEKLFINYYPIFSEANLNTTSICTKCYVVWGGIATTNWDYYVC